MKKIYFVFFAVLYLITIVPSINNAYSGDYFLLKSSDSISESFHQVSIVIFGNDDYISQEAMLSNSPFDLNEDWVRLAPNIAPPARYHHWGQSAYDSQSDRLILFSGDVGNYVLINDTWAYDYNTNTWENLTTPQMENNGRFLATLAYDSESDRIIMFGGSDKNYLASTGIGETWSFDYNTNTWTNMTPLYSPPSRGGHSMSYDEINDRMIIYGGFNPDIYYSNLPFYEDTWAYDYNTNTWTNMTPSNNPPPLGDHESAYDAESGKIIIFGGKVQAYGNFNNIILEETWVYDYNENTWVNMTTAMHPSRRVLGMMAYNSRIDRVSFYGGFDGTTRFDDTWSYDYNSNTWVNMKSPSPPSGRYSHTLNYDSESDIVILYGGSGLGEDSVLRYLDETWTYHFQVNSMGAPQDLQATLIDNTSVTLTWNPPLTKVNPPITHYVIYRGIESGNLKPFHEVIKQESLSFDDTEVNHGETYYYAIRAKNSVGEGLISNEITIDIPIVTISTTTSTTSTTTTITTASTPSFTAVILGLSLLVLEMLRRKHNMIDLKK